MKKNYFGKFFAIAMVFAGLSLTSCDKNDNAIINGQVWEPSSVQLVDGGAIVNADTPSEISRMIGRLRQDIIKAAQNKETFTITIDATAIKTTAADNTISFLTINNGDLVVNFTGNIITDEPLVLQSKGVDENTGSYYPAIAKVAFNFPAGTSNIDLKVDMPKASVTVKPTSGSVGINELSAKTAWSTLNIESGVTVNWLQIKGGYVVVKDGGKIDGLAATSLNVFPNGIKHWDLLKDSVRTTTSYTDDDYYLTQKGKLLANDNGYYSTLSICGSDAKASADALEVIIPDGVKAWIWNSWYTSEPNWGTVNITGEGDATIMTEGWKDSDGKIQLNNNYAGLDRINKLSNVTVDFTRALVWNSEDSKYEALEVDTASTSYKWCQIELPVNSENCTFNAKRFTLAYNIPDDVTSSTHKSDTFNSLKSEEDVIFSAWFPVQNDKRKSFTLAFDSCEFDQATFNSGFNGSSDDFKAYKAYISFDSSKIGGKAITKSTDMIYGVNNRGKWDSETSKYVYTTETFYTIDGVNYKPVYQDDKWYLVALD